MKRYVIFVGDEPSLYNLDPNVAFVGTKSYSVLLRWFKNFKGFSPQIFNSHTEELRQHILKLSKLPNCIVVALGNKAAERLDDMSVKYYKLPHPSPKNRMHNDKEFINRKLQECYNYIRG